MIRLILPWPPTVNTYWRHISKGPLAGRTLISEKGRAYRIAVGQACCAQLRSWAALDSRLSVRIEAHAPDLRKRDLDNLPKGILDSLSEARVWQDDSQIDRLTIERREPRKEGCVIVTIEVASESSLFEKAA
ncbi:MAG: RusA family crossover junction endodeoxyribonuclease [Rhodanobacteraceae bacterium]